MIFLIGFCLYIIGGMIFKRIYGRENNEFIVATIGLLTISGFIMMVISVTLTLNNKGVFKSILNFILTNFV